MINNRFSSYFPTSFKQTTKPVTAPQQQAVPALWLNNKENAYDKGYKKGIMEGYNKGFEVGYQKGQQDGYIKGHEIGYEEGEKNIPSMFMASGQIG